jgi:uncharacterized protein (DUF433 family)
MKTFERIVSDPKVMRGKPCIRGTRVPVASILGMLGAGHTRERILEGYPELTPEDIEAALSYAAWRMTESEANVV